MRRTIITAVLLAITAPVGLVTAPAEAGPRTTPFGLVPGDHVVLTVTARETPGNHDPNDKRYSKVVFRKTGDLVDFKSTGTGGTSESSGCKTVTLTNTGKSFLFRAVLFRYVTYTHFCWTRAVKITYDRQATWTFKDLDIGVQWLGEVEQAIHTFVWTQGQGSVSSGFRHYRRGGFQSISICFNIGCQTYSYPGNDLYVYANGTWYYHVFGADS